MNPDYVKFAEIRDDATKVQNVIMMHSPIMFENIRKSDL